MQTPGCTVPSTYGLKGERWTRCGMHKTADMVTRRCEDPECYNIPVFRFIGGFPPRCARHIYKTYAARPLASTALSTPTCKPDWTVLHIKCPRCSRVITSRELLKNGLECGAGCNVTMTELAAQCSVYKPLCYLFVVNGVVMYVGATNDFMRRMTDHATKSTGKLAPVIAKLIAENPTAKVCGWEYKMEQTGIKLHVSLHASELLLYTIQPKKPKWNDVPPPKNSLYRCVRLMEDGSTTTRIYQPSECEHRDAEALCLRLPTYKYGSNSVEWTPRRPRTTIETESLLDEVFVPGIGMLAAYKNVFASLKSQQTLVREGVKVDPVLSRVGHCEQLGFYGLCRCRCACTLKWKLAGEPEPRRAARFEAMEARKPSPFERQGVMASDDELTRQKVSLAMAVDEEIRRRKAGRKPAKFVEMPLAKLITVSSDLTLCISSLRAGQFYDDEYLEVRKDMRGWDQVYAQDIAMTVRRI